jgi:hypothetical protein
VESLIRLSILPTWLFSTETQLDVPNSKMRPPLEMIRTLCESEASFVEEATRQSHHDLFVSAKSYVRMLASEEIYDRMMNASLPRSLQRQVTRYNRALETYDTTSLRRIEESGTDLSWIGDGFKMNTEPSGTSSSVSSSYNAKNVFALRSSAR